MNEMRVVYDDENPSLRNCAPTSTVVPVDQLESDVQYHLPWGFKVLQKTVRPGDYEITEIKGWSVYVTSSFFGMIFLHVSVMWCGVME